jgi:hypothetical protein
MIVTKPWYFTTFTHDLAVAAIRFQQVTRVAVTVERALSVYAWVAANTLSTTYTLINITTGHCILVKLVTSLTPTPLYGRETESVEVVKHNEKQINICFHLKAFPHYSLFPVVCCRSFGHIWLCLDTWFCSRHPHQNHQHNFWLSHTPGPCPNTLMY